jgi:hypothetical protein
MIITVRFPCHPHSRFFIVNRLDSNPRKALGAEFDGQEDMDGSSCQVKFR